MPQCTCASEAYGSVFHDVSACVDCYSCSRVNQAHASKSLYRLPVMFTWILIRGFAKIKSVSFSSYAYA